MDFRETLDRFRTEGRLRELPPDRSGTPLLNLTLNDYMGLGNRGAEFAGEFRARFGNVAMTSSASRLLASDQSVFRMLEDYIENLYGNPALMFNSGYHANVGLVTALDSSGTLWATDKLIHASVIDGLRMANAHSLRWNHNDTAHLRKLIERNRGKYRRIIVVSESVYSMDGDIAPLSELVKLKKEFPEVMLYIDEAHALGCFGPRGAGLCAEMGLSAEIDILVGTLGKAGASAGAFAVVSSTMRDYLVNTARSLIFSTALPPANAAWSLLMLEKLAGMDAERRHLAFLSRKFREGIEKITGKPNLSGSAIVPLLTGSAARAVEISGELEKRGVLALPIRRPTVPEGGERIRFSLNATLTPDDISRTLRIISEIYKR